MRRFRNSRIRAGAVGTLVSALALFACNSILDFGQFESGALDAQSDSTQFLDAGTDTGLDADANTVPQNDAGDAGPPFSCADIDLTKACYSCDASTTAQFLNSCTDGTCITFDQARVAPFLMGGKLPPIPDGGVK